MKSTSDKLLKWTRKDWVVNVLLYLGNFLFLGLLFVFKIYVEANATGKEFAPSQSIGNYLNFLMLILFSVVVIFLYFYFEDRDFLKKAGNSEMVFLILEVSIIICMLIGQVNPYIRPLALAAILILFLTNSRTAVFLNFVFCIVIFFFDSFANLILTPNASIVEHVYYVAVGISSGIIAVYTMKDLNSRLTIFLYGFLLALPAVICILIPALQEDASIDWKDVLFAIGSGPLSIMLFTALLPVFEFLFNKVSAFKLAELTDHKSRLVRKIIRKAPGTFNHSIVVSNIAEACATAIGEDALLARTCAYYHDIGKLRRPEYFKENQMNEKNPHDDLTPELSANIINAHAMDGYNLVIKNRLPKEIADVCAQHHGTMPILYFYDKAKKFTDGDVDIAQYCYPGPKPQTKIAAIIMIADGCEAVARTLKDRSRESVKEAVKKIVNSRMELGQFNECEITLKELNIIINTVVNSLSGVYHNRIDYPKVSLDGIDLEKANEDSEHM